MQRGRVVAPAVEQADEGALAIGALGQQAHVFGEHAEEAAREEGSRLFGAVARVFEAARQRRELHRHVARHLGTRARRVQRHRLEPQRAQALAHRLVGQVGQLQPVATRVGEGRVGGAAARELGVELDDMAHVDDDEEGRPALGGRQRAGITLGLRAGAHQRVVEALGGRGGLDLLRFEHEGAAAIAIDEAGAGAAVAMSEGDAALEDIGVVARVLARRLGLGHTEQAAEVTDKELIVGALGARDARPLLNEGGGGVGRGHGGIIEARQWGRERAENGADSRCSASKPRPFLEGRPTSMCRSARSWCCGHQRPISAGRHGPADL